MQAKMNWVEACGGHPDRGTDGPKDRSEDEEDAGNEDTESELSGEGEDDDSDEED